MENICASNSCRHQDLHLVEERPAVVVERLGLGVLQDIVIPWRGSVNIDGCTSLIVPCPAWDALNCNNNTIDPAELEYCKWREGELMQDRWHTTLYLFLHDFWVLMAPCLSRGATCAAAFWKVAALKFLPSPASDLCSMRKLTKASSSLGVQWAVGAISTWEMRSWGGKWGMEGWDDLV